MPFVDVFLCREYTEALKLQVNGVVTDWPARFIAVRDANFTMAN